VVGLFPGSRRSELKYIFDTLVETAHLLKKDQPEIQFVLPVASSLSPELFQEKLAGQDLDVTLVQESIYDTAAACDAIVTVSGTVTLQIALTATPMAIVYKMNPLTFAIGKRLVKVPHIGLANIVAGREVVREFIQDQATPQAIGAEIKQILEDENYSRAIREGLAGIQQKMGEPGCSEKVARMASEMSRGLDG
jgi:lipid-A-disaccharide synthase